MKEKIENLTKLMLFNEAPWLPAEWKDWIPTDEEIKNLKYFADKKELTKAGNKYLQVKFPPDEKLRAKAFFWPKTSSA